MSAMQFEVQITADAEVIPAKPAVESDDTTEKE